MVGSLMVWGAFRKIEWICLYRICNDNTTFTVSRSISSNWVSLYLAQYIHIAPLYSVTALYSSTCLPHTPRTQTYSTQSTPCPLPPLLNIQPDITVMIQNLLILPNSIKPLPSTPITRLSRLPNSPLRSPPNTKRDFPTPLPPHIRITRMICQTPQRMHSTELRPAVPRR